MNKTFGDAGPSTGASGVLSPASRALLEELRFPEWLPDNFHLEEIKETHISLVIIGSRLVYKLKKPVDLGFIDHRDIRQRWLSCCEEVRLNRRLATDVYLGAAFVSNRTGSATLSEISVHPQPEQYPGQEPEPVVVMARLSECDSLSERIKHGDILRLSECISRTARRIAEFHRSLAPCSPAEALDAVELFCTAALDNIAYFRSKGLEIFSDLARLAFERAAAFTEEQLRQRREEIVCRAQAGCFVEGHGDLRAGHVYLHEESTDIIDCVEFSRDLRLLDRLNDAAFLHMDLAFHRREDLANQFAAEYRKNCQAPDDAELLRLYSCYRALVRAKVEHIAAEQHTPDAERGLKYERYISLASRYALGAAAPQILLVGGYMGAGKSTLSAALQAQLHAGLVRTDVIRQRMFDIKSRSVKFGQGKYSPENVSEVYRSAVDEMRRLLPGRGIVLIDATFSKRAHRELVYSAAKELNIPCLLVVCTAERPLLEERLLRRAGFGRDESEGRVELLNDHLSQFEMPGADEPCRVANIDTEESLGDQCAAVLRLLH